MRSGNNVPRGPFSIDLVCHRRSVDGELRLDQRVVDNGPHAGLHAELSSLSGGASGAGGVLDIAGRSARGKAGLGRTVRYGEGGG